IAGFLEFSRVESKDLKAVMLPFDVKTELYKIVEMAKPAASRKEIKVLVDIKESAPDTITADAALIVRAIKNLLDNAIKYTQQGGSVTARLMKEGTTTLIEIADTGIGIGQDHLPFIFDPFYRAGEDARGWGLGLAFVKKGIEAHGGAVTVKSSPGKGSTFTISLPAERT
ncbi:MAG TPA: HAMP domain-containing sensor histidine kinase, partial [Dissulfurispiraceae bacterium]|nr:HAMP domain-containing sensor histidine kinase [Dissulfurispiraceae bacterium]